MESQEINAPGVGVMSKKGPPPDEQEKKKTTVKVSCLFSSYSLQIVSNFGEIRKSGQNTCAREIQLTRDAMGSPEVSRILRF